MAFCVPLFASESTDGRDPVVSCCEATCGRRDVLRFGGQVVAGFLGGLILASPAKETRAEIQTVTEFDEIKTRLSAKIVKQPAEQPYPMEPIVPEW